jgi:hypothetical protein
MTNFVSFSREYRITLPPVRASNMLGVFMCVRACVREEGGGSHSVEPSHCCFKYIIDELNRVHSNLGRWFIPARRTLIFSGTGWYRITFFIRSAPGDATVQPDARSDRKGSDQTYTGLLTTRSGVLLGTQIFPEQFQKLSSFYAVWRFIAIFTRTYNYEALCNIS